jgi:3-deoxy-7-phosphoheptulonate synthase
MIIVMKASASPLEIEHVTSRVKEMGFDVHLSEGAERTIIGLIGDERPVDRAMFEVMAGVERTLSVLPPYKLASREWQTVDTVVSAAGVEGGGPQLAIIAGPCSVESRSQLLEAAYAVKEAGATLLRGLNAPPRSRVAPASLTA